MSYLVVNVTQVDEETFVGENTVVFNDDNSNIMNMVQRDL